MIPPAAHELVSVMRSKGYKVYDDFNLYGIRSNDLSSNKFNDLVGVLKRVDAETWINFSWPATTDPGTYHRTNPMSVHGTAVLKPGQYPKAYALGLHTGYPALQQVGPITVYRDANRNDSLELSELNTESGVFAINIHRANPARESSQVDKWSAGCQVLANPKHFDQLMDLAKRNGGPFTYTLLNESDFG